MQMGSWQYLKHFPLLASQKPANETYTNAWPKAHYTSQDKFDALELRIQLETAKMRTSLTHIFLRWGIPR